MKFFGVYRCNSDRNALAYMMPRSTLTAILHRTSILPEFLVLEIFDNGGSGTFLSFNPQICHEL